MLNLPEELMMGSSRVLALRVTVSFFARKAFILFSVCVCVQVSLSLPSLNKLRPRPFLIVHLAF